MSDQNNTQPRIFKTGAVRIVEDESMRGLDNEAVRGLLKQPTLKSPTPPSAK